MSGIINLIPSGFKFIDKKWGGIYKGGSYLLVGPRKSGRTLLSLQFAMEAAKSNEVCLYFTNMRPKDLMIQAASINFDLQAYMNKNLVIVVRVAPPAEAYEYKNPDEMLSEYLHDIIQVVNEYKSFLPKRIVFDELTQYLGFNDLGILQSVFLQMLEEIEDKNISSFFIVSEPAAKRAEAIVDVIASNVTGIIYLKKSQHKINQFHGGTIVITPNVGHTEGQFSAEYTIQPQKGLTVELGDDEIVEQVSSITEINPVLRSDKKSTFETDTKKTSNLEINFSKFDEHQLSNKTKFEVASEPYTVMNLYNYNDFSLILNNQIALYKSTGQLFTLLTFRLDPSAQLRNLLSINQLQNAIISTTDKKDKICVIDNKIIVLLVRSSKTKVSNLLTSLRDNLPSSDSNYLNVIMDLIYLFYLEVNDNIDSADMMVKYISNAEQTSNSFIPINSILK
ncbi:MAG: RAD55 family ATPase [bacterium]